jgi:dihydroorotase
MSPQKNSDYNITNVKLWTSKGVYATGYVTVQNGKLTAFGEGRPTVTGLLTFDGQGMVLMPAGVDPQVHLRVPGQAQKETPETGMLAALKGGYSAILTMPNTQPTIDSVEVLREGEREVKKYENDFGVKVFWSAAITKKLNSDHLTDFRPLIEAGVKAFTNDGLGVASDQVMDDAFAQLEDVDLPLLQHAEFLGHGGSMAPGPAQREMGATPYPDDPEWKMVERDLRELKKHKKARYHVLHVSSRKTLDFVKQGKADGLRVTAEVSPHHLYFNCEQIDPANLSFKMNPPIRSPEDQKALWSGLQSGLVDFVATDHAPHELLMKTGSIDKAAFGTIGMETALQVLLWGVRENLLTPKRLVEVFCEKPADFLRLPKQYGRWTVGEEFHGVLVDPAVEHKISPEDFSSLNKNSCFIGEKLPGKIKTAYHGERVFHFS